MESKTYRQSYWVLICFMLVIVLGLSTLPKSIREKDIFDIAIYIICSPIVVYAMITNTTARVMLSDKVIQVKAGKWMKPKLMNWDEIDSINDDSFLGFHIYHIKSIDIANPDITIPFSVKNYRDLLSEVIKRASNARVDESITLIISRNNSNRFIG